QPAPLITLVTVENGFPAIYWQPSSNPEVTEYAIYSSIDNFSTPIDTVKGRLSSKYVDLSHDANQSAGAYRIRSLEYCEDPKGLYSNISERYNTIFLSNSDEDVCKRSVILEWNGYNYHTQRVDRYRIEHAVNGADFELKEYVSDSVRKYEFVGLTPYAKNCIRIVAELPNGEESSSNIICLTSTSVPEVEKHYIENITVKGNEVHI